MQPEYFGCDVLMSVQKGQWHGIQRKEMGDLLASLSDGRLAKELAQMKRCHSAKLLIEGTPKWSNDGELLGNGFGQRFTLTQYRGLVFSVLNRGIGVLHSRGLNDTIAIVQSYETWAKKEKHASLDARPGPMSVWGKPGNEDYDRHLVQGIPGIGPELATRIIERFGLPFMWRIQRDDLLALKGVGKKKAEQIWRAIERDG
jgi:ERCC4-type nuclease